MKKKLQLDDDKMLEILEKAIVGFKGDTTVLESAVGALVMGRHFGWHVLRIMHSSRTFTKYEDILGVKFKEVLPARGPLASTVNGIKVADGIGKFWQALAGGLLTGPEVREKIALT